MWPEKSPRRRHTSWQQNGEAVRGPQAAHLDTSHNFPYSATRHPCAVAARGVPNTTWSWNGASRVAKAEAEPAPWQLDASEKTSGSATAPPPSLFWLVQWRGSSPPSSRISLLIASQLHCASAHAARPIVMKPPQLTPYVTMTTNSSGVHA